jgi:hypothetical protein
MSLPSKKSPSNGYLKSLLSSKGEVDAVVAGTADYDSPRFAKDDRGKDSGRLNRKP